MIIYNSIKELLDISYEMNCELYEVVIKADMDERRVSYEEVYSSMEKMYEYMKKADEDYDGNLMSQSGLAGGDGRRMQEYNEAGRNICSEYTGKVMEKALKMSESNACMKRIVAAPTAGSCGVIPAVLLSYEECFNTDKDEIIKALFIAAGIGNVIAKNASISGARGGCQAEIGSASAMAAGALCYLQGGDKEGIANAVALGLKNMLGLTCDPVCGLVEVPCIKRNVAGAINAISSAQLSLAGIKSAIDVDDVIDSMKRIGNLMPACLKETSEGGLATSASAKKIKQDIEK